MPGQPILFGSHYSVYTRIVHGTLLLKGVPFSFQELDIFATDGKAKAMELGNSFGKIPILKHGTLTLYETRAIISYLQNTFGGDGLFPENPRQLAVCEQLISIADNYIYPYLIWKLYVPFSEGRHKEIKDEDLVRSQECLNAVEKLILTPWACGDQISIADLYLEANLKLFLKTPFAEEMLKGLPRLRELVQLYQNEAFFQQVAFE